MVFYGLFTPLQGAPVIGAALARIAGEPISVTMVGGGQDEPDEGGRRGQPGRPLGGLGPRETELPALVASHHVCLGIFGTGDKALRVVPNKVFQGAAQAVRS